jgi:hypothetical protein
MRSGLSAHVIACFGAKDIKFYGWSVAVDRGQTESDKHAETQNILAELWCGI